jgi:hypothetical protein
VRVADLHRPTSLFKAAEQRTFTFNQLAGPADDGFEVRPGIRPQIGQERFHGGDYRFQLEAVFRVRHHFKIPV